MWLTAGFGDGSGRGGCGLATGTSSSVLEQVCLMHYICLLLARACLVAQEAACLQQLDRRGC